MITDTTILLFAIEMKTSVDQLIQWFSYLGIFKNKNSFVTQMEKEILFKHMNDNKYNMSSNKLILQRKTHSTVHVSSFGGKNKQVRVEIRKKLTYVQCTVQDSSEGIDYQKNKMISDVNNALTDSTAQDYLINKKIDDTTINPLLSTQKSKKNNKLFFNLTGCNKQLPKKVSHKVGEKYFQKSDDAVSPIKKKSENIWNVVLNKENITRSDLEDGHHDKTSRRVSLSVDNNKKLENERVNRVRTRARYRNGGKLTKQRKRNNNSRLYEIMSDEFGREEEQRYIPNRTSKNKRKQSALLQSFNKPVKTIIRDVVIGETISVSELASKMSIKSSSVIKVMMQLGIVATINQIIDQETAQLVVEEMGHNVILRHGNELEECIMHDRDIDTNCAVVENRAPIVTIMGHVDHGKTSLLDYIRSTKIASSELGGITQSIGAYHVRTNNGMITFLDTPGHAAFTAMRVRGVQLTDIVVLVVAADDGVMPQTIEAIQHIKAAGVPVVVAVNKIDKSDANPERIKNDLNNHGLVPEDWGGDTQFVNVSAILGKGIDDLLDAILLQSEILELKVTHHGMASAVVIDSYIDKRRGPIVSILVREGTLKCGDVILCGKAYGRVRAMRDEFGGDIISAGPSIPVELLGLSEAPDSGEIMVVVRDEKKAREVALYRQEKFREVKLAKRKESDVANIFSNIKNADSVPELNIIIKSDTQGSSEAISESLQSLSTNDIILRILYSSIGGITETDAALAAASNAVILGFNVRADLPARRIIETNRLDVRYYSVIYDLINEIKQAMRGMLVPRYKYETVGLAEVQSVFRSPKYGSVAGCIVTEGIVKRHKKIRVVRNNVVIHEGELESLRRFKNDVNEVKSGIECGIGIKNYENINAGDIIEVFNVITIS